MVELSCSYLYNLVKDEISNYYTLDSVIEICTDKIYEKEYKNKPLLEHLKEYDAIKAQVEAVVIKNKEMFEKDLNHDEQEKDKPIIGDAR